MKRGVLALLFCLVAFAASAQNVTVIGPITPGNVPQFSSTTTIKDSGVPGGTSAFANPTGAVGLTAVNGAALTAMRSDAAPPLSASVQSALTGTNGRILVGTGGFGFAAIVLGGDCTFTSPNITCTKVNGVSYGSSPATDTVPVVTASNTTTYTALPNCTVGTLNYSTATHLFSCGATGSGTVTSAQISAGAGIMVTTTSGANPCTTTCNLTIAVSQSFLTNSLGADVTLNASTYTDGPSVAQGTTGTWFASGTVTGLNASGNDNLKCKLWDGTTVIASGENEILTNNPNALSLSGVMASPAANLRISCLAGTATSVLKFNASGNSKDSTISVHRIQ